MGTQFIHFVLCSLVFHGWVSAAVLIAAPHPTGIRSTANPTQGKTAAEYNQSGDGWYFKGEYDKAIADYNKAIRLNPKEAVYYNNRGAAYRNKNDFDRAIADHGEAIHLNPTKDAYYGNRGFAYFKKNDYDRAIGDYNEAIRLNPNDTDYFNFRGNVYLTNTTTTRRLPITRKPSASIQRMPSFSAIGEIPST